MERNPYTQMCLMVPSLILLRCEDIVDDYMKQENSAHTLWSSHIKEWSVIIISYILNFIVSFTRGLALQVLVNPVKWEISSHGLVKNSEPYLVQQALI